MQPGLVTKAITILLVLFVFNLSMVFIYTKTLSGINVKSCLNYIFKTEISLHEFKCASCEPKVKEIQTSLEFTANV